MSFTDERLPGKTYKSNAGLKSALRALERKQVKNEVDSTITGPSKGDAPNPENVPEEHADNFITDVKAEDKPKTHIRNIHDGPVRVRLGGRSNDSRNIRLQGRGQRGDISRISDLERESGDYWNNLGLLFEAITEEEAIHAMELQVTNQQSIHPTLAALTNENGQLMGQTRLTIQPEYNKEQSYVVAHEVTSEDGRKTVLQRSVMPTPAELPGTQQWVDNREGGNPQSYVRDNISERQREMAADEAARSRAEGPAAGLGGFNVVLPQRILDPALRQPNYPISGAQVEPRNPDA